MTSGTLPNSTRHAVEVRVSRSSDFERIYSLLQQFDSPFTKDDWFRIFSYEWEGARDFVGFHLEHEGRIVGFMGLVFSVRRIRGEVVQFCNITSLIVLEPYRTATVLLIRRLQTIKNTIFTALRPIEASFRLFTIVGFVPFEDTHVVIPAISWMTRAPRKVDVFDGDNLLSVVDAECRRIASDHSRLGMQSLAFASDGAICMLTCRLARQAYWAVTVTKVHVVYISNVEHFNAMLGPILRECSRRWGTLSGLYVNGRFLTSDNKRLSIARAIHPPNICSAGPVDPLDIHDVYSETVLL